MKNILFIYAHMDDETILSYGTMLKYSKLGYTIYLLTLCQAGRKDLIDNTRINAYFKNMNFVNIINIPKKKFDLTLTNDYVQQKISYYIKKIQPFAIYTHAVSDLHFEHRLIAENVILNCRRIDGCQIKQLYCSSSFAAQHSYSQFGSFSPNTFIDISDTIKYKKQALNLYQHELFHSNNDIRSIESIITYNRQYGRLMNVDYCEAYQQIFNLL